MSEKAGVLVEGLPLVLLQGLHERPALGGHPGRVDLGLRREQRVHDPRVAVGRGDGQRCPQQPHRVHVRAVREELPHDGEVLVVRGEVQRRVAVLVAQLQLRPGGEQEADDGAVPVPRRNLQQRFAVRVTHRVHVLAALELCPHRRGLRPGAPVELKAADSGKRILPVRHW